jgi:ATP-dependent Clp protease, protease subunit
MDNQIKEAIKKVLKYTGLSLITLGLLGMGANVINTMIKDDYIGGPSTVKIAVPADNSKTYLFNDKLNKRLEASQDVKMTQIKFRNDRTIQLYGEVNEDTAQSVLLQLGRLNADSEDKPITLLINSPGGSVVDGALIVDAINGSKAPVNTLCVQVCASMAAFIHQYGKQRYVLPHAVLMFHPASGGTFGDIDRMASELAMFQRYVGSMELNAAKRANLSIDEYKKESAIQLWLTGEESVRAGFADGVVYVSSQDTAKLFQANSSTQETDKKRQAKKVKLAIKSFVVQILNATIQFINNSDNNSPVESIRRDFNDVPVKTVNPNNPDTNLRSLK